MAGALEQIILPLAEVAASDLGGLPIFILAGYLVLLLVLGYLGFRKGSSTEEDYYLAGRSQPLLVTVLTIMATMFSSAAMLGIPGLVYKNGAAFLLFTFNLPVAGAAVYLLGSRIRRIGQKRGYVTPGDLLSDYYQGCSVVRILVALTGFLFVLPYVIMQVKAGGHLAKVLFPDMEAAFSYGATGLAIVTMLYVLIGGMRSVAWSDVLQGGLLLGGMILAGIATVKAMGGVSSYFEQVSNLPKEQLTVPGPAGDWGPWKLLTLCIFGGAATMVQPGQWMRFYAASSSRTLRQSAMIFSIVLPACFLFGIMLVALGGLVLYPPTAAEGLAPHELVGKFDQIVPVMMREHIPALLGALGPAVVALLFVAILAASMSTADSNLHALSAVLTRDIYARFLKMESGQSERAWVGRIVIVAATLIALGLVQYGERNEDFAPLQLIAGMMLFAVAFACQLLPATIDCLYLQKGTRAGAIAGLSAGLLTILVMLITTKISSPPVEGFAKLGRLVDNSFTGFFVNVIVFAAVSAVTPRLPKDRVAAFVADLRGGSEEKEKS